ncbi:MAG: endolytic transglycosylase MltG [Paludibacteraceae bacterium]|nr:endolytic transglycosylase MltG [Paludibacteraceae bacterium]
MTIDRPKLIIVVSALIVMTGLVVTCVFGIRYYRYAKSNFTARDGQEHSYYVYPGTSLDELTTMLSADYEIASPEAWRRDCEKVGFDSVRPGHYTLPVTTADRRLIRMFSRGEETPVRLTFNNSIRTRQQLCGRLSEALMQDSATLNRYMDSVPFLQQYGLTPETAVCLFIPNTYEVYWAMTPEQLFDRMQKEYNRFWNDERRKKAAALGLTPQEVATLASIIEGETHRTEEHPIIASLYLNRLHLEMPLQACPTVIFAVGDFSMRRVLNKHLEIDSPYNTYKHTGLPPGPIRLPQPSALDAVLDAPRTNYLFMCANPDFSGTHVFSETAAQHERVAREYRRQLNQRKITK